MTAHEVLESKFIAGMVTARWATPSANWPSEAIPPAWREKIENRRHIKGLVVKLAEMSGWENH